jgi:hypothetical protein
VWVGGGGGEGIRGGWNNGEAWGDRSSHHHMEGGSTGGVTHFTLLFLHGLGSFEGRMILV